MTPTRVRSSRGRLASTITRVSDSMRSGIRLETRSGFTLVELLVVITIIVVILGMTAAAVNFTLNAEKLRSGSRLLQSYLEGARDRAIYSNEPRGVRFLKDQTDPKAVTSMVFIGPSEPWSQGIIRLERDPTDPTRPVRVVRGAGTDWISLKNNGLLTDGARIKIPGDQDGSWYTVITTRLTAADPILVLTTPYRDPGTSDDSQTVAFLGGGPSTYLLELPPQQLPGEEPVILPSGVVIDLDGSEVPAAWRAVVSGNLVYRDRMDVMFSPRGTVVGTAAASGLIHFHLAEAADVVQLEGQRPVGQLPLVPAEPEGEQRILSVFTRTGRVSTHPVEITDQRNNQTNAAGADGFADDPFRFAELGEEAEE